MVEAGEVTLIVPDRGIHAYIDGFVVPVPKKKLAAYKAMARRAGKVWKEYGALEYVECVADDVKWGKRTSFPRSVKMNRRSETVFFRTSVYKSRADPRRIMKKVMSDRASRTCGTSRSCPSTRNG
jgi:uncharacterized protein YbaA (DUF1428 family)